MLIPTPNYGSNSLTTVFSKDGFEKVEMRLKTNKINHTYNFQNK